MRNVIITLAVISGVSGLIILLSFSYILSNNFEVNGTINPQNTGITGDFIGGVVGTLWSLTGIFLFYLALSYQREDLKSQKESLRLQSEELRYQGEQLKLQREEMEETRKVVKEQSETMKVQKFETTFFNLIRNHSEVIKNLVYIPPYSTDKQHGYEVIDYFYKEIDNDVSYLRNILEKKEIFTNAYLNGFPDELLRYVKWFEEICEDTLLIAEFIENNPISNSDFYHRLLYNSLRPKERILLGFYIEYLYDNSLPIEVQENLKNNYFLYGWEDILNNGDLPPMLEIDIQHEFKSSSRIFSDDIKDFQITLKNIDPKDVIIKRIDIEGNEFSDDIKISSSTEIKITPLNLVGYTPKTPDEGREVGIDVNIYCKKESNLSEYNFISRLRFRRSTNNDIYVQH